MQTARLLEPRPRTLPAKLIEMIRAVHAALAAEFDSGLHALSLQLATPEEAAAR